MGAGTEIVPVLLGKRILDGEPGVQGEATAPISVFHRAGRDKAVSSTSTQPAQVSNNDNLVNTRRQTWQGYPVSHTRETLQLASSAGSAS